MANQVFKIEHSANVIGALNVTGNAAVVGSLNIGSGLLVVNSSSSNTTITGDLIVTGNASFGGNVTVTGTTEYSTNLLPNGTSNGVLSIGSTSLYWANAYVINTIVNNKLIANVGEFSTSVNVGSNVSMNLTSLKIGNASVFVTANSSSVNVVGNVNSVGFVGSALSSVADLNVSGTTNTGIFNATTHANVGSNVRLSTTSLAIGNSAVNSFVNSSLIQTSNSLSIANLTPTTLAIGTVTLNALALAVGSNLTVNGSVFLVGNSIENSTHSSTLLQLSNSSSTSNLTSVALSIGNVVVNSSAIFAGNSIANVVANSIVVRVANSTLTTNVTPTGLVVGPNVQINSSAYFVGNATVNTIILSTGIDTDGTLAVLGATTLSNTLAVGNTTVTGFVSITQTIAVTNTATFSNNVTIGGDVTVSGNLVVSGTTTYVNTATLNVADNIITLNADVTGAPTENSGVEVKRGTSANVAVLWNETSDKWTFTNDGSTYLQIASNNDVTANASAAYSNAIAYSGNAAQAYANAIAYSGNAALAYANAIAYSGNAAQAYANAIAYSGNAAQAYANAIAYSGNAAQAYANAIAYSGNAAQAYSNAITFAANATNLGNGTVPSARIAGSYTGITTLGSVTADSVVVGNSTVNSTHSATLLQVANSTGTANLTPTLLEIGIADVNSSAVAIGANVVVNATTMFVGNATVNSTQTSTQYRVSNSTSNAVLSPTQLTIGNTTVNASYSSSQITINGVSSSFLSANTRVVDFGNSVSNVFISTTSNHLLVREATGSALVSPTTFRLSNATSTVSELTQSRLLVGTIFEANATSGVTLDFGTDTSSRLLVTNSTSNVKITPVSVNVGTIFSVNTTVVAVTNSTSNSRLSPSSLVIGNSSVQTTINSSAVVVNGVTLGGTTANVYTGSDASHTDYPIGTVLLVNLLANSVGFNANQSHTTPFQRNASNAIKFSSSYPYDFVESIGSGTTLTGTWRARGGFYGNGFNPEGNFLLQQGLVYTFFQRTE